jgi:hypothetical protein
MLHKTRGVTLNPREFIANVRKDNQNFYDTEEGRGLLETFLPRTFPEPWIYVFELIQNALDTGATQIEINTGDDELTFSHDGRPLEDRNVRALSKLGMSTKGINSVGFMGVGFKSVFHRFCKVGISDKIWKVGFHLTVEIGSKGDRHPNWVKTVMPDWWPELANPKETFTTTFYLSELRDPNRPLTDDLNRLFDSKEPITLAVLAIRGLRSLCINGENCLLDYNHDQQLVTLYRDDDLQKCWSWCTLVHEYQPSEDAIRSLLEFRKQRVKEDEDHELAQPRQIVGFVPLDEDHEPIPPRRGRVYAALPTDETICMGMHIQGDWFVDVTRQGLMKVEGDYWQMELLRQVPKLLAKYLRWLVGTERSDSALKRGFKALRMPDLEEPQGKLDPLILMPNYRDTLHDEICNVPFVPTHTSDGIMFVLPSDATSLPEALNPFGEDPSRRPDLLFGSKTIHSGLLVKEPQETLRWLGLSRELTIHNLKPRWPDGLKRWWEAITPEAQDDKSAQRQQWLLLFSLWRAIESLSPNQVSYGRYADRTVLEWRGLPVIPTEDGEWKPVKEIRYLNEEPPTEKEQGYMGVKTLMEDGLPKSHEVLCLSIFRYLKTGVKSESIGSSQIRDNAYNWFKRFAQEVTLSELLEESQSNAAYHTPLRPELFVDLAKWAIHRKRPDLVDYVIVGEGDQLRIDSAQRTVLADPYLEDGDFRRAIFSTLPAVSSLYLDSSEIPRRDWMIFFETTGSKGALKLQSSEKYFRRTEGSEVLRFIEADVSDLKHANNSGYIVKLYSFESIKCSSIEALQRWLEMSPDVFKGKGRLNAKRSFNRDHSPINGSKLSPWAQILLSVAWVPDQEGIRHKPTHILSPNQSDLVDYEGAPIAQLKPRLLEILENEGLKFGSEISRSRAIRLLERHNGNLSCEKITELLAEALEESSQSKEERRRFDDVLKHLLLPLEGKPPLSRIVRGTGAGIGRRSSLNGFIPALSDLDEALSKVLQQCLLTPIPATTTGEMALDFLEDIWRQARERRSLSADRLRSSLSAAYTYILHDLEGDSCLQERWDNRSDVLLYVDSPKRMWTEISEKLCFDDLSDPRLRSFIPEDLMIVSAGYLGDNREHQIQTASAMGVQLLSEVLNPRAYHDGYISRAIWEESFSILIGILNYRQVKLRQRTAIELSLKICERLSLHICDQDLSISVWLEDNTLLVVSDLDEFTADASAELVNVYQLSHLGGVVPHLTLAFSKLDDYSKFLKYAKQLAERLDVPFEEAVSEPKTQAVDLDVHSDELQPLVETEGSANDELKTSRRPQTHQVNTSQSKSVEDSQDPTREVEGSDEGHDIPPSDEEDENSPPLPRLSERGSRKNDGDSPKRQRSTESIAGQNKYAPDMRGLIRCSIDNSGNNGDRAPSRSPKDDKRARDAVIAYEVAYGRAASAAPPGQPGYDVESRAIDGPIRRIEIKGNEAIWHGESSVKLSRRQFDDAREPGEGVEYWLYVVDELRTPRPRVLPIPWTKKDLSFFFHAEDWEIYAEHSKRVALAEEISVEEDTQQSPLHTSMIDGLDPDDWDDEH